jgi:hypothetical protein
MESSMGLGGGQGHRGTQEFFRETCLSSIKILGITTFQRSGLGRLFGSMSLLQYYKSMCRSSFESRGPRVSLRLSLGYVHGTFCLSTGIGHLGLTRARLNLYGVFFW